MIQKLSTIVDNNYYIILACLCMFGGQFCVWFGTNSQIVWKWWADKPMLSAILFGIPRNNVYNKDNGLCFVIFHNYGNTNFLEINIKKEIK